MNKMIEKVARASFECWRKRNAHTYKFEDMNESELEFALEHAKVCIEALREPTAEMQNHYYDMRMAAGQGKMQSCFPFAAWECAIDAALKE